MGSSSILIADEIHPEGIAYLKANGYETHEQFDITPQQLMASISFYEGLIVRSRTRVTKEIIEAAKKMKIIARAGTGVDNIDTVSAKERNIIVVNARGANSEAVAEHTLALILMIARNLLPTTQATASGKWEKKTYTAMELEGKTLGILGLGMIGFRVAQFGRALGMIVIAHSRTTETEEKKKQLQIIGGRFVSFEELLSLSDVVSIHTPLTSATTHLVDAHALGRMKKTAYLINAARGEIVDEVALAAALKGGVIAGAGLDVFSKEPLPADSTLLSAPNIILTPHVASVSREGAARISFMIAEDIVRVLKGEAPKRPAYL